MADENDLDLDETRARQWIAKVEAELLSVEALLQETADEMKAVPGDNDTIMLAVQSVGEEEAKAWDDLKEKFNRAISQIDSAVDQIADGVNRITGEFENAGRSIRRSG